MATVEEIITRYSADDRYSAKVVAATQKTKAFGTAVDHVHRKTTKGNGGSPFGSLTDGANDLIGAFGEAGSYLNMIIGPIKAVGTAIMVTAGAAAAGTIAFAGFAKSALDSFSEIDSLKRGLAAVSGSADSAAQQFEALRSVAKLPGLGITEAVQGALQLQAAGVGFESARRDLLAFGNALASAGKGKEDLQEVVLQLSQLFSSGKLEGDELKVIRQRVPQFSQALVAAFGTASSEAINKLGLPVEKVIELVVAELEKLPKVTGGIKNTMENFSDSTKLAMASAGKAIADNFAGPLERAASLIENMTNSGVFEHIADVWSKMFGGGKEDLFVNVIAYAAAVAQALPTLIETAVQTAKDGIKFLVDEVMKMIRLVAVIGGATGAVDQVIKTFEKVASGGSGLDPFRFIRDQIQQSYEEFKAMANAPDQTAPALADALSNSPLKQIQLNTKTTADVLTRQEQISRSTLGGGTFGNMGITPVELGGMKRRGRTTVEGAIRYLVAAVEQQTGGAVMQGMLSRARVTR